MDCAGYSGFELGTAGAAPRLGQNITPAPITRDSTPTTSLEAPSTISGQLIINATKIDIISHVNTFTVSPIYAEEIVYLTCCIAI